MVTTRTQLIKLVKEDKPSLSSTHKRNLISLSCWLISTSEDELSITFADMIRGLVPIELRDSLYDIGLTVNQTEKIIATTISVAQIVFKRNI